jgi:hypothetical protein
VLELLVAGAVFMAAALGSLQLWGEAAASSALQQQRLQQREGIERDRLLLQQHWRLQLGADGSQPGCVSAARLLAEAATLPPAPALQRQLQASADGAALLVEWGDHPAPRRRWYTAAGLGLCASAGALTDSQVEGLD